MTTRVEHMLALKAAWEKAQAGPQREAALKNYEAAQKRTLPGVTFRRGVISALPPPSDDTFSLLRRNCELIDRMAATYRRIFRRRGECRLLARSRQLRTDFACVLPHSKRTHKQSPLLRKASRHCRFVLRYPTIQRGTVTLIGNLQANDHGRNDSRGDGRAAPGQHSLSTKHAQGSAGDQMALDVEHIVRRGLRESAVPTPGT